MFNARMPGCKAEYNSDQEMIYFRGGPKMAEDVTIHQPDQTILKLASFYCMKMSQATGNVGGSNR